MDSTEERLYTAVIITAIVLGVIIVYFVISIVKQQRRIIALQRAHLLAEITAMEKERARIAVDLHDDLGPVLSVIKFQVDHVETGTPEEISELRNASQQLDSLITRIREISNNLMPSALKRKGLVAAVDELTTKLNNQGKFRVQFSHSHDVKLNEEKTINLYRCIQELIHNSIKHSGASEIDISLNVVNDKATLLYKDNGKGFDYHRMLYETSGIGIRSLKNRTDMMNGTIKVDSRKDEGTHYLIEIPIS